MSKKKPAPKVLPILDAYALVSLVINRILTIDEARAALGYGPYAPVQVWNNGTLTYPATFTNSGYCNSQEQK